jgi:hypothetical protein
MVKKVFILVEVRMEMGVTKDYRKLSLEVLTSKIIATIHGIKTGLGSHPEVVKLITQDEGGNHVAAV